MFQTGDDYYPRVNVCVCLASGVKIILPLWGGEFQPLTVFDRGSFFHCRVVEFQPWVSTCYIIFAQLLGSKYACVPGFICMMYVNITLSLHIHSLVIQRCLGVEPRYASSKGYYQSPTLNGSDR